MFLPDKDYNITFIQIAVIKMYSSGVKSSLGKTYSYQGWAEYLKNAKKVVEQIKKES